VVTGEPLHGISWVAWAHNRSHGQWVHSNRESYSNGSGSSGSARTTTPGGSGAGPPGTDRVTQVERNFGYAVAKAYAGHTDNGTDGGATATYVRATTHEVAVALATLTREPHPLATQEGWAGLTPDRARGGPCHTWGRGLVRGPDPAPRDQPGAARR